MFSKSAWNNQVFTDTYDPALEKFFANQKISDLDTWVFDKVKDFFAKKETATQHDSMQSASNDGSTI